MTVQTKSRVAVAQLRPAASSEQALQVIDEYAAKAVAEGAQLLLLPEAYIGGYPRLAGFGATVGQRTDAGRDDFRRYWEQAIDIPGPAIERLEKIAGQHGIMLVAGVIERDGGTLYCTVAFISAQGKYLAKHRKLMPTGSERLIWGFGNGSTLPVLDTPIGKVGAVICWENYMPLMRAAHYAKGIQIYCAPTADGRETWLPTMRCVALEGRCFVLSANQFARQSDYPDTAGTASNGEDPILSRGGSCIIDPFGKVLAGPDFEGEALLVADIDLNDIPRGKYDFDVTGHYARPDVFTLLVNEHDTRPVVYHDNDRAAANT